MELASWVCVTYNRPKLLQELYNCFIHQDYPNLELIIVNDQKNLLYECEHERVHIYNYSKRFESLGRKRNFAKSFAKGEYIFFTDDDDYYLPNFTSELINQHKLTNDRFDVVEPQLNHQYLDGEYEKDVWYHFSSMCFRRKYIKTHDFNIDFSVSEDAEYLIGAKECYYYNEEPLTYYRRFSNLTHMYDETNTFNRKDLKKQKQVWYQNEVEITDKTMVKLW